jgi:ubiquinone/menaquinone biosynthesis C-methylase UbiE
MQNSSENPLPDARITFFDRLAADWDTAEQDPADTIRQLEAFADLLELRHGEGVLEVGCGTGQLTGWLADRVCPGYVLGIDFSPAMIAKAKAKKIPAEFRVADVCQDALGENRFDLALCFHSFPHFRDKAAALRNIAAALKPDGRLLVVHLNSRTEVNRFHDQVGGEVAGDHLPDDAQWEALLAGAGLRKAEQIDREGLFLLKVTPSPALSP